MTPISSILARVQAGLVLVEDEKYNDEGRREWMDVFNDTEGVGTPWERTFARDLYARFEFTPKQREVIDRMAVRYAAQVNY